MYGLASTLQFLSAACLGVYAGAMLTEGFVLVPWWRSLAAAEFFAWYAANDARLLAFFSPVTSVTAVVALVAAAASMAASHPARRLSALSCLLVLFAVAMFFVYFEGANAAFSAASIAPGELPAELARWEAWHHVRTVIAVAALVLALVALRRPARAEP